MSKPELTDADWNDIMIVGGMPLTVIIKKSHEAYEDGDFEGLKALRRAVAQMWTDNALKYMPRKDETAARLVLNGAMFKLDLTHESEWEVSTRRRPNDQGGKARIVESIDDVFAFMRENS